MATYKEIKGVTVQTRDEDPVIGWRTWASGGYEETQWLFLDGSVGTQTLM